MCADEECQCSAPHEKHIFTTKLKGVVQQLEKATVVPEEVKTAKVLVARLFDDMIKAINQAWQKTN